MFEQILPDLFRIEVPLPVGSLKVLNSYVIRGPERSLVIDTGMNEKKCLDAMLVSLEALDMDMERTDFFITHLHADHVGLVENLSRGSAKIYLSEADASIINFSIERTHDRMKGLFQFYVTQGYPKDELEKLVSDHPANRYIPRNPVDFNFIKEGDAIDVGKYSFRCIHTPGHSPGHMCLYERRKKILVSGDHILFDITPNITWWPELENALKAYLDSLRKVSSLEVNLVLPGHRSIRRDLRKRIAEIQEHHETRLGEVIGALENRELTAWDIAPHLTWDIDVSKWELFPFFQKWFAFGETIAHIKYLEAEGRVKGQAKDGRILYSL